MEPASIPQDAPARARVLVIDDELSLRHALARGLRRADFETVEAATGKEGVDAFLEGGFDAVLTDVRLPDLSGLDIASILTEMDASIPVVVMTGYGTLDTALEAMRRGARDYVQKPFVVEEVARVLKRAIAERRLSRENRRLRALVERRLAPENYAHVEEHLARLGDPSGPDRTMVRTAGASPDGSGAGDEPLPLEDARRGFEVHYVEDLLSRTGGNVAAAARLAGISRPNFHKKLRTLGVDAGRFKEAARRGRTAGS